MSVIQESPSFRKMFRGETPCEFVYEDEQCVVFNETYSPQAPVHFVVVPKTIIPRLAYATESDEKILAHLMLVARNMALQNGLDRTGYHVRVEENYGSKPRLTSFHVFGRALHHMIWPVGPGCTL